MHRTWQAYTRRCVCPSAFRLAVKHNASAVGPNASEAYAFGGQEFEYFTFVGQQAALKLLINKQLSIFPGKNSYRSFLATSG